MHIHFSLKNSMSPNNIMLIILMGLSFLDGQVSLEHNLDGIYFTDGNLSISRYCAWFLLKPLDRCGNNVWVTVEKLSI